MARRYSADFQMLDINSTKRISSNEFAVYFQERYPPAGMGLMPQREGRYQVRCEFRGTIQNTMLQSICTEKTGIRQDLFFRMCNTSIRTIKNKNAIVINPA
jgi:hypothetical protein